jgi:hypothetical protein
MRKSPPALIAARIAILTVTMMPASRLQAHPGHDFASPNLGHWVTSPDHLTTLAVILLGMGVALWATGRFIVRGRRQCWMESFGLIVGCSAGVLWGLGR